MGFAWLVIRGVFLFHFPIAVLSWQQFLENLMIVPMVPLVELAKVLLPVFGWPLETELAMEVGYSFLY